MEHTFVQFEGKNIHYQSEGEGEKVLVFLHGYLNDLNVWASYIYSYMRNMRVIDLPGHGLSDTFDDVHTMEFMAQTVKAVLDAEKVTQCVLMGHSMGGYVSLAFAEAYPEMLKGLILLHSQALVDNNESKANRLKTCETVKNKRVSYIISFIPELFAKENREPMGQDIKEIQEDALRTSERAIVAAQKGMLCRKSRVGLLSQLDIPILFIFGKKDQRIPLEIGLSQAMLPKYSETIILGNSGHMGHFEERKYLKLKIYNFAQSCYYLP